MEWNAAADLIRQQHPVDGTGSGWRPRLRRNCAVIVTNGAAATSNALTFTILTAQNGPQITSLSPPSMAPSGLGTGIGVAFLPLVVNGSGFVPGSVVHWNGGGGQPTTFISPTQLKALIADDEIPGSPTSVPVRAQPRRRDLQFSFIHRSLGGASDQQSFSIQRPDGGRFPTDHKRLEF